MLLISVEMCIHHISLIFSPRNGLQGYLTFSIVMINMLLCVPLKPTSFHFFFAAAYYVLFEGVISDGRKADFYIYGIVKIASILVLKKIKIYVKCVISLMLPKAAT